MHYYIDNNVVGFGEINFEESTQDKLIWKTGIVINFNKLTANGPWIWLGSNSKNDFTVLKNEGIFNVLEDFCWSGEYEETLEDLVKCLQFWEFEKLDPLSLNTEKIKVDMEE